MIDTFPMKRNPIAAAQHAALRRLLGEILPANRFYAGKLKAAGISGFPGGVADFLRKCPFTLKPELVADRQAFPPYGSNLTFPAGQYTRISRTSGTHGRPLYWLDTPEDWEWLLGTKSRVFQVAGLAPGEQVLFPFSFGPFLGFWSAFEAALRLGLRCFPAGGMNSAARLRVLCESPVGAVCCTPTYALRLGEAAREEGIDLSRRGVRALIVGGEPGGSLPATVSRIETLWPGARVYDHHGMTETGTVSYPCPAVRHRLHVIESAYLAEVLEPGSERPVPPGETGELILTTLGRHGAPLLRYRSGDLVRPATGTCPCGSEELALDGGILGRLDDMVVVRGVNLYPGALDAVLGAFADVAEYRVEVDRRGTLVEVRLQIEPQQSCRRPEILAANIQNELQARFSLRIPVEPLTPGALPRFEMKAKRWIEIM